MVLTDQQIENLTSFIGYGNPSANIWFVGSEEGLGGAMSADEISQNLLSRGSWRAIMDMRAAHLTLREGDQPIDIERPRKGHTGVWRWMSKIMLAVEGCSDWSDAKLALSYAQNKLGREGGATFLTELRPFPAARADRPQALRDIADEITVNRLLAQRREGQLSMLNDDTTVICYGLGKRNEFADHFKLSWQAEIVRCTSRSGRARMVEIGRASKHGAKFLLVPFLGNGQMSRDLLTQIFLVPRPSASVSG